MSDNFATLLEQDGYIDEVRKVCPIMSYRITSTFEPNDTVLLETTRYDKEVYVHIIMTARDDGSSYMCRAFRKDKDNYSIVSATLEDGKSLKQVFNSVIRHIVL